MGAGWRFGHKTSIRHSVSEIYDRHLLGSTVVGNCICCHQIPVAGCGVYRRGSQNSQNEPGSCRFLTT